MIRGGGGIEWGFFLSLFFISIFITLTTQNSLKWYKEKLSGAWQTDTLLKVACFLGSFYCQPYVIRTYPISTNDRAPNFYKKVPEWKSQVWRWPSSIITTGHTSAEETSEPFANKSCALACLRDRVLKVVTTFPKWKALSSPISRSEFPGENFL